MPVLDALREMPQVRLVAVVSAPDRPAGRHETLTPTPVAARARELGLSLLQPARIRSAEAIESVRRLRPDLAVLADYGQLIPSALLELPRYRMLNLHPSPLPRHRGASPVPAAILAGDRETAVTLMVMTEAMDEGPIVAVEGLEIRPAETAPELEARAAAAAAELLRRSLPAYLAGDLPPRPQPDTGVSLTRPLRRTDSRLDPGRPAAALERQVRAYLPWPGSHLETNQGRLLVWRASVCPAAPGDEPGRLVAAGDGLALTTADGRLQLDEVQLAGRRRMTSTELRRGFPGLAGSRVA